MQLLKVIAICTLLIFGLSLTAQEQIGLRTSTYAGMNGSFLNPSSTSNYSLQWEVNLVSAGVFLENNFAFITNTSNAHLANNANDLVPGYDDENNGTSNFVYDFYSDTSTKRFSALNLMINGPSVLVKTKTGQSFGAFYNLRFTAGAFNVPGIYNFHYFNEKDIDESIPLEPIKGNGMFWSEIGLHFSQRVETSLGFIGIGVNAKYLQGYEAAYANLIDMTYSMSVSSDTVSVDGAEFEYGYTSSNLDVAEGASVKRNINGRGIGFDLGFTLAADGYDDKHLWKIGASLLDVGSIVFNNNSEAHRVETDEEFEVSQSQYKSFDTVEEIQNQLSQDALGALNASLQGMSFNMWLPTALSLQADVNIWEGLFVSANLIQRLAFADIHTKRGNLLNLTPRYEHKWGELHFPISLYNYKKLNVGAAARIGFLTVGTENLGSFMMGKTYTGTDFYVGLKIFNFSTGLNLGPLNIGGSGKNVKCYNF